MLERAALAALFVCKNIRKQKKQGYEKVFVFNDCAGYRRMYRTDGIKREYGRAYETGVAQRD